MKRYHDRNKAKAKRQVAKYYREHRTSILRRAAEYRKRNKGRMRRLRREWGSRNSVKERAHWNTKWAIKSGKLVRPTQCSKCGTPGKVHAHHPNYTKYMEVEWLCRVCHGKVHGKSSIA